MIFWCSGVLQHIQQALTPERQDKTEFSLLCRQLELGHSQLLCLLELSQGLEVGQRELQALKRQKHISRFGQLGPLSIKHIYTYITSHKDCLLPVLDVFTSASGLQLCPLISDCKSATVTTPLSVQWLTNPHNPSVINDKYKTDFSPVAQWWLIPILCFSEYFGH